MLTEVEERLPAFWMADGSELQRSLVNGARFQVVWEEVATGVPDEITLPEAGECASVGVAQRQDLKSS